MFLKIASMFSNVFECFECLKMLHNNFKSFPRANSDFFSFNLLFTFVMPKARRCSAFNVNKKNINCMEKA